MRDDLLHHPLSLVDVGQFAAAEDDGYHHLVFVKEEVLRLVDLELDVVLACLGTEPDLLDLGVMNVGFVVLLFLLVLELDTPRYPELDLKFAQMCFYQQVKQTKIC